MKRTMFIVATNLKTWGKGTNEVEALFNALQYGANAKQINIIKISKIPKEVDMWTSCGMNDKGEVVYPKGSNVKQIMVDSPDWLGRKFADLFNDLHDLLQGEYNIPNKEPP